MIVPLLRRRTAYPPLTGLAGTPTWDTGAPNNQLSWDAYPGATDYRVLRDGIYIDGGSNSGFTTFSDNTGTPGTTYTYEVRAVVDGIETGRASVAVLTYDVPSVSFTPSAQGSWSTTPQGPGMAITATITDLGDQPVTSINFYTYVLGVWVLAGTQSVSSTGDYSQSLTVGVIGDQGQQLDYRFGFVNDAGETTTGYSTTWWPVYSPQYFAQGAGYLRQANPDSGVYPWRGLMGDATPNGLSQQPIYYVYDWDHGTQIAIGRPSYLPVVEENYDNGWPVVLLDYDSGASQVNNFEFHDGTSPVKLDFGTDDFTMYFVFWYDATNGAALLCNYDGINVGDPSTLGVIGSLFFMDSAGTNDTLWSTNIPDAGTSGWRVLVLQKRLGILYGKISDAPGTGSSGDYVTAATGAQAFTGIGADDGGYNFGADLRVKAFGLADYAYDGEIDFLFDYLVNTFL